MDIKPLDRQSPHSDKSSASLLNAPPVRGGGFDGTGTNAPSSSAPPPALLRLRGGGTTGEEQEEAPDPDGADAQREDAAAAAPDDEDATPPSVETADASAVKTATGDDNKTEEEKDVEDAAVLDSGGDGDGDGDAAAVAAKKDTEAEGDDDDDAASTPAKLTRAEMKKRLRPPLGSYEENDDLDDDDDEEEEEDDDDDDGSSEEEVPIRKKRRKGGPAAGRSRSRGSPAAAGRRSSPRRRSSPGRPRSSPGRPRSSPGRPRSSPGRRGRPARDPSRRSVDDRWNGMFEELIDYKEEHGDCLVPYHSGKLGRWVKQQRVYYKDIKEGKGKTTSLSADRIARLENVGFCFAQEGLWMIRFNELRRYREQHGDAMVPKDWPDNLPLARWVEHQRKEYRKRVRGNHSTLTEERMSMLRELDFDFTVAGKRGPRGRGSPKVRRYDDEDDVEIRVVVIDGVEKEIEVKRGTTSERNI